MNQQPREPRIKSPAMHRPLVLVSSRIDPELRQQALSGQSPTPDVLALADALDADILDTCASDSLPGWRRRIEDALACNISQARIAWQRRGEAGAWVSTSEKIGLPLALLGRSDVPHIMIAHNLMSTRKRWLEKSTGILRNRFDAIICLSAVQEAFLRDVVNLPPERIYRIYDSVDANFWRPTCNGSASNNANPGYLLAVGRENRDYPTLIEAAKRLNVPLTIISSSPWSTGGRGFDASSLPPNVTVRHDFVAYTELRALYENARLVVVPLRECSYAAGVNGAMEAMAMAKATVVTGTLGLKEYLVDGVTNRVVPPGDTDAMAEAVRSLWADDNSRRTLGNAGRERVEREMSLDIYVAQIVEIIKTTLSKGSRL